jgi:lactoylglutathione lyase/glyoxylase I family protein
MTSASDTDTDSTTAAPAPFASWLGHHAAIRVPDYDVSTAWFVDRLGWRIVQEWMYGDLQLAYIAPPGDDHFHVEILAGPGAEPQPQFDSVDASLTRNGLNHVCIQVASVDDSLAELRRRDVRIVGEPFELAAINSVDHASRRRPGRRRHGLLRRGQLQRPLGPRHPVTSVLRRPGSRAPA